MPYMIKLMVLDPESFVLALKVTTVLLVTVVTNHNPVAGLY